MNAIVKSFDRMNGRGVLRLESGEDVPFVWTQIQINDVILGRRGSVSYGSGNIYAMSGEQAVYDGNARRPVTIVGPAA